MYKKVEIQDIGGRLSIIVGERLALCLRMLYILRQEEKIGCGGCFALYFISLVSPYNKSANCNAKL